MTFLRVCLFPALVLPGFLLALLLILLLAGGCGGPTQVDRDNGRVLVEVMTALTLKNARLLEASRRAGAGSPRCRSACRRGL